MKKLSLQIRVTILFSILLVICCVFLTFVINISANKMVEAVPIIISTSIPEEVPAEKLTKPKQMDINTMAITEAFYPEQRTFRLESVYYMTIIIVIGSVIIYFITGKVLKPINELTNNIKNKNVNNLDDKLKLPKYKDEVYYLTLAFEEMSNNLKKSFQLQKQFSSDVSHELRTPLAVMQTKLEVFKLSYNEEDEEVKSIVCDMLYQLEKLKNLIDDLLWFSKDTPLENVEEVDIYYIVVDICDELYKSAKEKNINFIIEETSFIIKGNDGLLERVLYNLLENAIKYSQNNTNVGVDFNNENKTISVWDQGEEIKEKELVFEPFYREDKYNNKGKGLGLSICKKILEKHNATIKIEKNKPKGNIFKINFS